MRTLILALPLLASACVVLEIHEGDGVSATEPRDVGAFSAVRATADLDVFVTRGDTPAATVTCDENLLGFIVLEVRDDTLVVRTGEGDHDAPVMLDPHTDCRVDVVAGDLTALTATGAGDLHVAGAEPLSLAEVTATGSGDVTVEPTATGDLAVLATGSGNVTVAAIEAGEVELTATGSGDLTVTSGHTGGLDVVASGSGDVDAAGLSALEVHVQVSGSGDAAVTATDSIEGTVSGSGDLTVTGAPPQRDVVATGSGEVHFVD